MKRADRDSGSESAFASLVAQVADPVRRYLWRRTDGVTADEVLAETLVVLWRRRAEVPVEPVPWAIGVARLQLANAERSARRRALLQARLLRLDPPEHSVPGPAETDDVHESVRIAMGLLAPGDAELLRLSSWEELTTAQIATMLGITPNATSIRLHRARRRFKAVWRKTSLGTGHGAVTAEEQR